jgi:RNA polymerase sigma-70 factor, ECF subfamily
MIALLTRKEETEVVQAPAAASPDERRLLAALRAREERAFVELIDRYGPSLLRVARLYVSTDAVAEEVVQETLLGVLNGVDAFEGRSSLKTWIFRIASNSAKTRGLREGRSIPLSSLDDQDEPTVDPQRFFSAPHRAAGQWVSAPERFDGLPEERLLARETRDVVAAAIAALPPFQRAVITLRDVDGCESAEVCDLLEISRANERVLLHRARARVRQALERYLGA